MKERNIGDDDLRRSIEKAHELSTNEQNNLSLEDVKQTASELGIPEHKVMAAYKFLEEEKLEIAQQKARKKALVTSYITAAVILAVVILLVVYTAIPRPYKGDIRMTLTSAIANNSPVDDVKEVRLFQQTKIVSFLKLSNVTKSYNLEWKFYAPNGELFDQSQLKLNPAKGTTQAWATLNLPMSAPLGDWKVEIWLEDKMQKSFPMKVSLGHFKGTMTSKLGTDEKKTPLPENIKTTFVKGEDNVAICYLFWDLLSADRAAEIAWKWLDPQGKQVRDAVLKTAPAAKMSWFRGNHGLPLKDATPGEWTVEVYYADVKIESIKFVVKEKP